MFVRALLLFMLFSVSAYGADPVRVAVAANFYLPAKALVKTFSAQQDIEITLHPGATGSLYHQITQGAPYQIYLAADETRPQLLLQKGLSGKPQTYALGRLALWAPGQNADLNWLNKFTGRLVIADAKLAPYGVAAEQLLKEIGNDNNQIIRALSVAQVLEYVSRGVVSAGLLSVGQLVGKDYYSVPQKYYSPIVQQAVLLNTAKDNTDAQAFWQFLFSEQAREIIKHQGFGVLNSGELNAGS